MLPPLFRSRTFKLAFVFRTGAIPTVPVGPRAARVVAAARQTRTVADDARVSLAVDGRRPVGPCGAAPHRGAHPKVLR